MSEPATRASDLHRCTVDGTTGPVGDGSQNVLVHGLTFARLGDLCACGRGHESPLAEGAASVLVNDVPAVRVGARTLDGGSVIAGDDSVLVGGETISVPPSFISIEGTSEFRARVVRDLYRIASTPSGQKLFESMDATGRKLRIRRNGLRRYAGVTLTDPQLEEPIIRSGIDIGVYDHNDPRAYDHTGIDATIQYDSIDEPSKPYSSDATLFHEMTHADDMMHGALDPEAICKNPRPDDRRNRVLCGERRAVGLPPYDDTTKYPYSENTYRKDRGLKEREWY